MHEFQHEFKQEFEQAFKQEFRQESLQEVLKTELLGYFTGIICLKASRSDPEPHGFVLIQAHIEPYGLISNKMP